MALERVVLIFAGTVILAGLILNNLTGNAMWLWLSALPGIMLIVTGLTRFCPLALILKKFGLKPGQVFHS